MLQIFTKKSTITRYLVKIFNKIHMQNHIINTFFILLLVIKVLYSFYFLCDKKIYFVTRNGSILATHL